MFGTMSARWHKVLREVWGHKARTALVVLSMAAGVFGVGMNDGQHAPHASA
jgi:hypothetical protein